MKPKTCPECGSKNIELNGEGEICKRCGLVLSDSFYSGNNAVV